LKSAWRENGYSPIGIVFDRTPATSEKFPFATWRISADWMEIRREWNNGLVLSYLSRRTRARSAKAVSFAKTSSRHQMPHIGLI